MRLTGTIKEDVYYFNEVDQAAWRASTDPPDWLIREPIHRFIYCRMNKDYTPKVNPFSMSGIKYFMTARYIADHHEQYDLMWHERYKLAEHRPGTVYARSNREVEARMGKDVRHRLIHINKHWAEIFPEQAAALGHKRVIAFKDPDAVAYGNGRFSFLELKNEGEKFSPFQRESLAVLQHIVSGARVRVVRTIAAGKTYTPSDHPYDFEIPDSLLNGE